MYSSAQQFFFNDQSAWAPLPFLEGGGGGGGGGVLSSLSSINAVSALSFGRFNKWGEGALRFSQFNQWWVRMNLNFYIIIRGWG